MCHPYLSTNFMNINNEELNDLIRLSVFQSFYSFLVSFWNYDVLNGFLSQFVASSIYQSSYFLISNGTRFSTYIESSCLSIENGPCFYFLSFKSDSRRSLGLITISGVIILWRVPFTVSFVIRATRSSLGFFYPFILYSLWSFFFFCSRILR